MNCLLDKIMLSFLGALILLLVLDFLLLIAVSAASQHYSESVLEETGKVITEYFSEEKPHQNNCSTKGALDVEAQYFMASTWDS